MKTYTIYFDEQFIYLKSENQEIVSMPLEWFPKLYNATQEQRANYTLSPFGIHWEALDEDLSFEGFYSFKKELIKS